MDSSNDTDTKPGVQDALSGTRGHIGGFHTFTVTTQTKVIARGMLVGVTGGGSSGT